MHGLKTIHRLNQEATEAAAICEKHGVALGDIPAPPAESPAPLRIDDMTDDELLHALDYGLPASKRVDELLDAVGCHCGECSRSTLDYDLPNIDESGK